MRTFMWSLGIGLPLCFFLTVWATPPTTPTTDPIARPTSESTTEPAPAPTWTVELRNSKGIQAGDRVEEAGQAIGHVVRMDTSTTPTQIVITLFPDTQDRLRERTTFFVAESPGSARPALRLVVFDPQSAPLPPGSVIAGAESEMEVELRRQLAAMESAVQTFTKQVETFNRALDTTKKSEEKRQLEDSVGNLFDTLQQTRDDVTQALGEEVERWKDLYDQLFPPTKATPKKMVL